MSRLCVLPIIEGHGEDGSIRTLLQRIWTELLDGEYVEVLKPIRVNRYKVVQSEELGRVVNLAAAKLREATSDDPSMILILIDAENDAPCVLGPDLLRRAREHRGDVDISCVLANVQYETWFVAAAPSLGDHLDLSGDTKLPESPEAARLGKAWIKKRIRGIKYSETVDQPSMTKAMDLSLCRSKSPSFDKLCRELEVRLNG
ncbi:MAG TPA: DUF4276 family protein [Thermoanaerobaculia bacterium]|nr:DUF4276 family protein [Thermoanaerobaculia bacterium]